MKLYGHRVAEASATPRNRGPGGTKTAAKRVEQKDAKEAKGGGNDKAYDKACDKDHDKRGGRYCFFFSSAICASSCLIFAAYFSSRPSMAVTRRPLTWFCWDQRR